MPIYLTEYGYFASRQARAAGQDSASRYLQQAYSIALKNGRVKSQLQYLLLDAAARTRARRSSTPGS